jgi:hypothetical protein
VVYIHSRTSKDFGNMIFFFDTTPVRILIMDWASLVLISLFYFLATEAYTIIHCYCLLSLCW